MSDYDTIQRNRNFTVGAFVLLAAVAFVWLVFKFGDMPTKVSEYRSYQVFVRFPRAQGVQKNTPVRFCGYQVGRVTHVMAPELLPEILKGGREGRIYHQTMVILRIDKQYDTIPSNVQINVMTRGLGSSYIEIEADPNMPLEPLDPNDPATKFLVDEMILQGYAGMTSEFFPKESQQKLDNIATSIIRLLDNINDIVGNEENKQNIEKTLANAAGAAEGAKDSMKEFKSFLITASDTSEQLTKAASELRVILEKVNTGKGTAAKFMNDGKLYENLLDSSDQLQAMLEELTDFIERSKRKGLPIKLK